MTRSQEDATLRPDAAAIRLMDDDALLALAFDSEVLRALAEADLVDDETLETVRESVQENWEDAAGDDLADERALDAELRRDGGA